MEKQKYQTFHHQFCANAYEFLGSHPLHDEQNSVIFRVFAPRANEVYVVGDFNNWLETDKMQRITEEGIFEVIIKNVHEFQNYKYLIKTLEKSFLKADPYSFHNETNGSTSSKIYDLDQYTFNDEKYFIKRNQIDIYNSPVNIYEVHFGSWKRYKDGNYFDYRKLANELIPYVKKMGYTHIEVMPIMEYPYDRSWGYQVTGYFSVTSRYGTPKDFMYFVDKAHQNGLGVIMDWVPAHFPKDDFSLYEFDGSYLYEDNDLERMEHPEWGTRVFNYAKPEVKSFLISSAVFFFEKYHIDGLRVDAVASMLYLDYGKDHYKPNVFGGNYHLEAIDFLKDLNTVIFQKFPYALMIAEESTAFPNVTKPVDMGGLGFNFKWNMGWMNDTLSYMKTDPMYRKYHHNKVNFSMCYAYSENFILPISHDEVVYGKCSLVNKMPGSYDQKFANDRAYLGYMMTHPGKKLTFMGIEFAQFSEWDFSKELDWNLLSYDKHFKFKTYVNDLNKFYLKHKELWEKDQNWDGFKWINPDDSDLNILSYRRMDAKGNELVIVINFSGNAHYFYRIGVNKGSYKEVLNSDESKYGGDNFLNEAVLETEKVAANGMDYSLVMRIPALSIVILKRFKKNVSKKTDKKG